MIKIFILILSAALLSACHKDNATQPAATTTSPAASPAVQCRIYWTGYQWTQDGCGTWSQSDNVVWGTDHADSHVFYNVSSCSKCDSAMSTLGHP